MSLTDRIQLFFSKIERYIVQYSPLRITMYDTIKLTQKLTILQRLRRTVTSYGS